jgi:hypothetical protein
MLMSSSILSKKEPHIEIALKILNYITNAISVTREGCSYGKTRVRADFLMKHFKIDIVDFFLALEFLKLNFKSHANVILVNVDFGILENVKYMELLELIREKKLIE